MLHLRRLINNDMWTLERNQQAYTENIKHVRMLIKQFFIICSTFAFQSL